MNQKWSIAIAAIVCAGLVNANAPGNYVISPGDTWKYANANADTLVSDVTNFQFPSYDDSGWYVGAAPFSNLLDGDFAYNTYWAESYHPVLRKTIDLPAPMDVVVNLGIDRSFDFYVNGGHVLSGTAAGDPYRWEYTFTVPAYKFSAGENVIAIQLLDQGGVTAFDLQMLPEPHTGLALLAALVLRRRRQGLRS